MKIRITETNPNVISDLIKAIPEFWNKTSAEEISDRCCGKQPGFWCSWIGDTMAGFLVSYALDDLTYYNWIMGVLPDFRRQGCGTYMIDHFESCVAKYGFRKCAVKSMNRYRSMMALLIRKGYDILLVEADGKIYFEKKIEQCSGVGQPRQ